MEVGRTIILAIIDMVQVRILGSKVITLVV
jgi:hypothetical protein